MLLRGTVKELKLTPVLWLYCRIVYEVKEYQNGFGASAKGVTSYLHLLQQLIVK